MNFGTLSSGALSALAGAAMLAASASPSPAFTLSSPSLERPFAASGVQQVWWDRWGRWHPNYYYHPYYYHPYYYHPYYYHPYYRHCWYAYGVRRCY